MQQTGNYKLNLIEKTDKFSPDPLNENMEKVDGILKAEIDARTKAVAAEAAVRAAAVADLDQRLKVFEVHKTATGTYTGGRGCVVDVGFVPEVIFIHSLSEPRSGLLLYSCTDTQLATLTETGFTLPEAMNDANPINARGKLYFYVAFG